MHYLVAYQTSWKFWNNICCGKLSWMWSESLSLLHTAIFNISNSYVNNFQGNCSSVYNLHEAEEPNPI